MTVDRNTSDRWSLYKRALEMWGEDVQIGKLGEECGELSAESNRFLFGYTTEEAFAEEIADAEIMIEQMRQTIDESKIEEAKGRKINRLQERLEEAENNA